MAQDPGPRCKITRLPVEVLVEILKYLCCHCERTRHSPNGVSGIPHATTDKELSTRTFLSLSRTCRQLSAVAQPFLYHSLTIRDATHPKGCPDKLANLIDTLNRRPHLKACVSELDLVLGSGSILGGEVVLGAFPSTEKMFNLETDALPRLISQLAPNLKRLSICSRFDHLRRLGWWLPQPSNVNSDLPVADHKHTPPALTFPNLTEIVLDMKFSPGGSQPAPGTDDTTKSTHLEILTSLFKNIGPNLTKVTLQGKQVMYFTGLPYPPDWRMIYLSDLLIILRPWRTTLRHLSFTLTAGKGLTRVPDQHHSLLVNGVDDDLASEFTLPDKPSIMGLISEFAHLESFRLRPWSAFITGYSNDDPINRLDFAACLPGSLRSLTLVGSGHLYKTWLAVELSRLVVKHEDDDWGEVKSMSGPGEPNNISAGMLSNLRNLEEVMFDCGDRSTVRQVMRAFDQRESYFWERSEVTVRVMPKGEWPRIGGSHDWTGNSKPRSLCEIRLRQ